MFGVTKAVLTCCGGAPSAMSAVPQALRGAFGFGIDEVEARIRAVAGRS